jgi:hypothetical protein
MKLNPQIANADPATHHPWRMTNRTRKGPSPPQLAAEIRARGAAANAALLLASQRIWGIGALAEPVRPAVSTTERSPYGWVDHPRAADSIETAFWPTEWIRS